MSVRLKNVNVLLIGFALIFAIRLFLKTTFRSKALGQAPLAEVNKWTTSNNY